MDLDLLKPELLYLLTIKSELTEDNSTGFGFAEDGSFGFTEDNSTGFSEAGSIRYGYTKAESIWFGFTYVKSTGFGFTGSGFGFTQTGSIDFRFAEAWSFGFEFTGAGSTGFGYIGSRSLTLLFCISIFAISAIIKAFNWLRDLVLPELLHLFILMV